MSRGKIKKIKRRSKKYKEKKESVKEEWDV